MEINKQIIGAFVMVLALCVLAFTAGYYVSYKLTVNLCNDFVVENYATPIQDYYQQGFQEAVNYTKQKEQETNWSAYFK